MGVLSAMFYLKAVDGGITEKQKCECDDPKEIPLREFSYNAGESGAS